VAAPPQLTDTELAALVDPDTLIEHAWALEPWSRYAERAAALDRLEAVIASGEVAPPPPGRDWRLEVLAERSIDAGRERRLDTANALVDQVVAEADPTHQIALGRAMLGSGQALAWIGTDEATRQAHHAFGEAADLFAALGQREWQGSALLRRGYSACYQYGDIAGAEALIRRALETYAPDSERLPGALSPYADVLTDLGEFDRATQILDQAAALAERDGVHKAIGEIAWARARVAAGRADVAATERLLLEAEREATAFEWFDGHIGMAYLLEATELLDRLGVSDQAQAYFERARARADDDNEEIMQTAAVLHARSGNPDRALEELQRVVSGNWLEKRVIWRHTLLTAWATFRAGRNGAGELAARALQQASACGTVQIAVAGEPDIVAALTPLAEQAGSAIARELLLAGRPLLVRLFGSPSVRSADGAEIALPPGKPSELVRLLALHSNGLPVDVVLETFFPEISSTIARQRLRQVLTRLRAAAGELVVRDGENLRLLAAWVDVREFLAAGNRVSRGRGQRPIQLAYGALTLHAGPFLPSDPYADWAEATRQQVRDRHLALLDMVAADARARGSHQEALTAMDLALEEDPDGDGRHEAISRELSALGRHGAAGYVARLEDQR
jgi:DNA-binding SARP family transcriptional activator